MAGDSVYYAGWYKDNKERLAKKRAARYQNDPAYREKIIANAAKARMKKRGVVIPEGYSYHMVDAAEILGVTIWQLREWRKKNWFPEPMENGGRLWFTANQITLLQGLRDFLNAHGNRVTQAIAPDLENAVNLLFANWGG